MNLCPVCNKKPARSSYKYCSNKCQREYQYRKYIENWKNGLISRNTKNISRYIKKYLLELYGEKCTLCGWNKINSITGRVPLEVDHINGNANDNKEENLRLICPNCHSLSPTFRNLNKGKGRIWRNLKYMKAGLAE